MLARLPACLPTIPRRSKSSEDKKDDDCDQRNTNKYVVLSFYSLLLKDHDCKLRKESNNQKLAVDAAVLGNQHTLLDRWMDRCIPQTKFADTAIDDGLLRTCIYVCIALRCADRKKEHETTPYCVGQLPDRYATACHANRIAITAMGGWNIAIGSWPSLID